MLKHFILIMFLTAVISGCDTVTPTTHAIPTLQMKGEVYKTQGPNDPLIYDSTTGTKSVIVVFCDFPDRRATDETTEQRSATTLGGTPEDGTFQTIFRTNSYGKVELDITEIHGWRTMPLGYKTYDPTTTEGHRKMFEDAFALYPEIDFNDFDYALVLMTAKGNFAFGERPPTAIPHRGQRITVGVTQSSRSPYTLAHELAHCMGLPDVYTYGGRVPEGTPMNPFGPWDIMSGPSTGFVGWHRHKLDWLDADRKTYLTQGTHRLTLADLDAESGVSMVVVPAIGEDVLQPSKVYVLEVAQYLLPSPRRTLPKPRGVLVYSVDGTKPTGFNPCILYPREDKLNAAYHVGDTFQDEAAPFDLTVLSENEDGSYEVEITIK
jgi:M6 family metalloprotease-like protein